MIRALARAVKAAWYLPLFTVMTLAAGAVCLAGSLFSGRFARTVSGQVWGSIVLGPAFIGLDVKGAENVPPGGGFIVYANHRSLLDIPAASMAVDRPLSWVAKSALGRIPVFGWVLKRAHMLVEREGGAEAARKMITEAEARLAAGEILAIFPEGTRNRDAARALLPFKKGAFILAKHTGVPLVPLAIVNSGALWPSRTFLPKSGYIKVVVGKPLNPAPRESLAALTARAREALERLYLEAAGGLTGTEAGANGPAATGKPREAGEAQVAENSPEAGEAQMAENPPEAGGAQVAENSPEAGQSLEAGRSPDESPIGPDHTSATETQGSETSGGFRDRRTDRRGRR
ncbi:MAG: 1-acylglycerol-3-phosphate O-acyltransferase [Deltaproteobacteria bacterium]|jgi:1-acyl-sn-glycerol-3-phosphate acyltransferase|nr:1-acylglycerol-3-phosphate O-acyltransferase [Deltaproteobacteria bacterium]